MARKLGYADLGSTDEHEVADEEALTVTDAGVIQHGR